MKKLVTFLFAALISIPSFAQERPSLTPGQKLGVVWVLSNAVTALTVGWIVLPAATLAGKKESLCSVMEGTYNPSAADQCEGGDWVRIVPYLDREK